MDEMHVKENLVFDKHSGCLVGFSDLGHINNHISRLERAKSNSQKVEPLAKSLIFVALSSLKKSHATFSRHRKKA